MKLYSINKCTSDRFAGLWPIEQFAKWHILVEQSARAKNDIYIDLLPLVNSARASLLDHPKLTAQLLGLERRTSRGGRDSIDHAAGTHDDLINAAAGALVGVVQAINNFDTSYRWVDCDDTTETEAEANARWRVGQLHGFLASHIQPWKRI